jgi:hypothetical protein
MDKETGLAIQKAYKESLHIIKTSKTSIECRENLEVWLGQPYIVIDYIELNFDSIKNRLDKKE